MKPADLMAEVYELRLSRGWSLTELSIRSGVAKSTLSRAERGIGYPRLDVVLRWLDTLGYDLALRERT